MKRSVLAAIGLFSMAAAMPASAADLPRGAVPYKAPAYVAQYNWTGFYVGINGGYAWGNSSVAFAANDPAALAGTCGGVGSGASKGQCINAVDFHRDGPVAGGQFGFIHPRLQLP